MAPQYEGEKDENVSEQKGLNGLQMVQFKCPRHCKSSVSFSFGVSLFLLLASPSYLGRQDLTAFRAAAPRHRLHNNGSLFVKPTTFYLLG